MSNILKFSSSFQESRFYQKVILFDVPVFTAKMMIEEELIDINEKIPMTLNKYRVQRLCTTLLFAAVTNNNENLVDYLLQHNADVNLPVGDYKVCTPLHKAIRRGHLSIVKKLIVHGANLEQPIGRHYDTPLEEAIKTGDYEIIKALVDGGAKVNNLKIINLESLVLMRTFHRILHLLCTNNAEYKLPMERYSAMFAQAVWNLKSRIIETLMKIDIDVIPDYDNHGKTRPILYQAVTMFSIKTLQLLLSYHKFPRDFINRTTDDNCSLLHVAVQSQIFHHVCIVKLLLNAGIDVDIEDNCGKLAIDYENVENAKSVMEIKKHIVRLIIY